MSNRSRGVLVGGTLALLASAGTAAGAFTGADDSRTAATSSTTSSSTTATSAPAGTSISVRPSTPTSTPTGDPAGVTAAEAERTALDRVGGGRVVRTEREPEHGRWEWHVRIEGRGGRYDIRVDAETGAVTRSDGDDHGGRRGRGGDDG